MDIGYEVWVYETIPGSGAFHVSQKSVPNAKRYVCAELAGVPDTAEIIQTGLAYAREEFPHGIQKIMSLNPQDYMYLMIGIYFDNIFRKERAEDVA